MQSLLGIDLGSSSVKVSLISVKDGSVVGESTSPNGVEMSINAPKSDWAEQDPELWVEHTKIAIKSLIERFPAAIKALNAIGISYQMHGLVVVDRNGKVLRPSIIWCDSRAVENGKLISNAVGAEWCTQHLLNQPGNFTLSKLFWVKNNEPEIFSKIYKFMLPGDYLAYRLTGEISTTATGLSEGILWNFKENKIAKHVLDKLEIDCDFMPNLVPAIGLQGKVSDKASAEFCLPKGTAITFRGGDQPVNAFALGVVNHGQAAVNAGTSGVIYAVSEKSSTDYKSRVNSFLHVNSKEGLPLLGILMCLNGTGIFNSWIKKITSCSNYAEMDKLAAKVSPGSDGLLAYPFGNGAERILGNSLLGASLQGINFNVHTQSHTYRAVQEGIIYALNYGIKIIKNMGTNITNINAGYANMFLSPLFREIFSTVTDTEIKLFNTNGAQGAARGAGLGAGIFRNYNETFHGVKEIEVVTPNKKLSGKYRELYVIWEERLLKYMDFLK